MIDGQQPKNKKRDVLRGMDFADLVLFAGDRIGVDYDAPAATTLTLRLYGYAYPVGNRKNGNLSQIKW